MRKFLLKLLVYTSIITVISFSLNVLYVHKVKEDVDKFSNVPNQIQVCNFGSSHGYYGFNYDDVPANYTCFNFALSSQSLVYDYKILQYYEDKIQNGAIVFIPVSYFSLFGKPEHETKDFASKNKRYYKFLPSELITQYDWKTDLYVNWLPPLSPASLVKLTKIILGIDSDDNSWEKKADPADVTEDASHAYERHIEKDRKISGKRIRCDEAFDALYGIIELCRKIGTRPILVTVPYLKEYTDTVRKRDPEFYGAFYAVVDEVRRKAVVEYYDYAFDERFTQSYELFMNSDHLNREGARIFTDILFREVLGIEL